MVLGGCAGVNTPDPSSVRGGDLVRLLAPSGVEGEVEGVVGEVADTELLLRIGPEHLVVPTGRSPLSRSDRAHADTP